MIVVGVTWCDEARREVAVVGRGDRAHLDRVLAMVPDALRDEVARHFAPMLEGGLVPHGHYDNHRVLWWKPCEVVS